MNRHVRPPQKLLSDLSAISHIVKNSEKQFSRNSWRYHRDFKVEMNSIGSSTGQPTSYNQIALQMGIRCNGLISSAIARHFDRLLVIDDNPYLTQGLQSYLECANKFDKKSNFESKKFNIDIMTHDFKLYNPLPVPSRCVSFLYMNMDFLTDLAINNECSSHANEIGNVKEIYSNDRNTHNPYSKKFSITQWIMTEVHRLLVPHGVLYLHGYDYGMLKDVSTDGVNYFDSNDNNSASLPPPKSLLLTYSSEWISFLNELIYCDFNSRTGSFSPKPTNEYNAYIQGEMPFIWYSNKENGMNSKPGKVFRNEPKEEHKMNNVHDDIRVSNYLLPLTNDHFNQDSSLGIWATPPILKKCVQSTLSQNDVFDLHEYIQNTSRSKKNEAVLSLKTFDYPLFSYLHRGRYQDILSLSLAGLLRYLRSWSSHQTWIDPLQDNETLGCRRHRKEQIDPCLAFCLFLKSEKIKKIHLQFEHRINIYTTYASKHNCKKQDITLSALYSELGFLENTVDENLSSKPIPLDGHQTSIVMAQNIARANSTEHNQKVFLPFPSIAATPSSR